MNAVSVHQLCIVSSNGPLRLKSPKIKIGAYRRECIEDDQYGLKHLVPFQLDSTSLAIHTSLTSTNVRLPRVKQTKAEAENFDDLTVLKPRSKALVEVTRTWQALLLEY